MDDNEVYTLEFVKKLCYEVMNLGMSTKQSQLNGFCTKSGREILEEFLRNKL